MSGSPSTARVGLLTGWRQLAVWLVPVDDLAGALLVTVESVVRPQVASLWLRGGDR